MQPVLAQHASTHPEARSAIIVDGLREMTPCDVAAVARLRAPVALGAGLGARLEASRAFLAQLVDERRRIYGVTTGYGPLATSYVTPDLGRILQRNLVYHLAAGVGAPLSAEAVRAMMFARLIVLARGHSAVDLRVVEALARWLNSDLVPFVPAKGTVGASGDLTPLAHMTLAMMGEGAVLADGKPSPSAPAIARAGIAPLQLDHKDGIALVNGTSAMTAIAALNAVRFANLQLLARHCTLLHAEMMSGQREAWNPALAAVRPHQGQKMVTEWLWRWSEPSRHMVAFERVPPRIIDVVEGADGFVRETVMAGQPLHQDVYTIRCAPQVLGAVADQADQHRMTVQTELNAVTDNPLIFADAGMLVHGGNFHGQPVAFASDQLMMALVKLAILAERQLARLTHPVLNGTLPAFLQPHRTGLDSGFMGAQVTASALVAEMRSKSVPASIQSVPTNGDNQDTVSMGTIAARRTADLLDDLESLLAIQALALAQAADIKGAGADGSLAPPSRHLHAGVRKVAERLERDRPLAPDIEAVRQAFATTPEDFVMSA